MSEAVSLMCPHADICSVCSWIAVPSAEQKQRKIEALDQSLKAENIPVPQTIPFLSAGLGGIRDRVDLIYSNGRYGFFQKQAREIFKLEECPIMSPELFDFYKEVRKIPIPIQKGSLRLRISPRGLKGLWLDFANEDIRDLLAEKKTLQSFLDLGFVEVGQKRKKLAGHFKLVEPEFHPWTRTWSQGKEIELLSLVGSFSQSGDAANRILVGEMERLFNRAQSSHWIEFGAGSGNLTFPLAGASKHIRALEFDSWAVEGLQKTLQAHPALENQIEVIQGDFQRKTHNLFRADEGVLVNPPRSGLQKFLDPLFEIPEEKRPKDFVYMSCYLESFTQDGKRLHELGYRIQDLSIVDQFPNSPHFEILSRWQRA